MRTCKDFGGVSVTFFAKAIEALSDSHGERTCARIEELRKALEEVERIWLESPPVEEAQP